MAKETKLKILRDGFTPETIERIVMTDDWILLRAIHQSDLSDLTLPSDVDYSHCMFHEVVKSGPTLDMPKGLWVVIIRNALDGLTSSREYVVAKGEDVVMMLDPDGVCTSEFYEQWKENQKG